MVADDDHQDKFNEVPISLARRKNPEAQLDDTVEFNVTPKNFGRIAVQTAKQTMMQRLRQAEKEMIYDEFKDRAGDIVSGAVRRFEKNDVMIDLGKFEARMPSRERVTTEDYNIGDRIRAYVVSVDNEFRGPEIILSRSHPNFRAPALRGGGERDFGPHGGNSRHRAGSRLPDEGGGLQQRREGRSGGRPVWVCVVRG